MMFDLPKPFGVMIASPSDYENLVAEIYYGDYLVALITAEGGLDNLALETPGVDLAQECVARKVDLRGFLQAVEVACQRLRGELP